VISFKRPTSKGREGKGRGGKGKGSVGRIREWRVGSELGSLDPPVLFL